jgi:hypothetical protein
VRNGSTPIADGDVGDSIGRKDRLPVLFSAYSADSNKPQSIEIVAARAIENKRKLIDLCDRWIRTLITCSIRSTRGPGREALIDECHHLSAVGFETVAREAKARYVLGLSATLTRKDGHHPIIFMQCGPIRYRADAKKQAAARPFDQLRGRTGKATICAPVRSNLVN